MVSACLLGENCKYNGGNNRNQELLNLLSGHEEIAEKEKPDLIILQSRSPSCGVKQIYDGTFSGKLIPGHGVFAELVLRHACIRKVTPLPS